LKTGGFLACEHLRGRDNFSRFSRARQYRGFYIRVATVTEVDGAHVSGRRAAFVVSKKVAHRAVDRNRLKRQLRELYRKCRTLLPQDIWLMFIALPEAIASDDFSKLEEDFIYLSKKIASKETGNLRNKTL
jgi:ribonuclease P protein component